MTDQNLEEKANESTLHDVIDQLCEAKNVFQGNGPAMAYFQTPPDSNGVVTRYTYVIFGTEGIHEEGHRMRAMPDFAEALRRSTEAFDEWLQRGKTLAWRKRPEVYKSADGWLVYWRCVQLDDGARRIAVDWHF